jgi:hypothetical protein
MPGFIVNFFEFVRTTPLDQVGNMIILWVTPFLVFCVCVWGFLEVWLDRRQEKFVSAWKWITLQVVVPQDAIQTPKGIENFFSALSGTKSSATFIEKWFAGKVNAWHSFELVSEGGVVSYYIRTQERYRNFIEAAFYAQYPEAQFTEVEDYAEKIPTDYPNDDYQLWGGEIVLKNDEFLPMRTWEDYEHQGEKDGRFKDPLFNILEVLGSMQPGENYSIQLIISTPDSQDWVKAGQKFIDKVFGKPEPKKKQGFVSENVGWLPAGVLEQSVGLMFGASGEESKQDDFRAFKITPFEKDQIDAVTKKISKYGFLAKMRFVYWAKTESYRKGMAANMTKGILGSFLDHRTNGLTFVPSTMPQDDYPWQRWAEPSKQRLVAARYKNRSFGSGTTPKIMNVEELATLWHFPAADARTPVLTAVGAKRSEAPVELNFAPPTAPILQNMDRSPEDGVGPGAATSLPEQKPLAVPDVGQRYTQPVEQQSPNPNQAVDQVSAPQPQAQPEGNMVPVDLPQTPELAKPQVGIRFEEMPGSHTQAIPTDSNPQVQPSEQQSPVLPTMPEDERKYMPKPGMPAPLPPGLDISDQPLPPDFNDSTK